MAGDAYSLVRELLGVVVSEVRGYYDRVYEAMGGERVAREAARFYRVLVDSGVPRELAGRLTILYLYELLEALRVNPLMLLSGRGGGETGRLLEASLLMDRGFRARLAAALLKSLGVPGEEVERILGGAAGGGEGAGGETGED